MSLTETPSGLLIATDKKFTRTCPWCDTGFTDEEFDNRTYIRHVERCVPMEKVEEFIHIRKTDPISIRDEEQIKFLRDASVTKGIAGSKRRRARMPKPKPEGSKS